MLLTVDGTGKVEEYSLENVKFQRYPLNVGEKAITLITDTNYCHRRDSIEIRRLARRWVAVWGRWGWRVDQPPPRCR